MERKNALSAMLALLLAPSAMAQQDCHMVVTAEGGCLSGTGWANVVNVENAQGELKYLWSNEAITRSVDGLANGTYWVKVYDETGCEGSAEVTIACEDKKPCDLILGLTSGCTANQGWVNIASVQGATEPYTVLWSNGGNGNGISGLANGTYTATVTDYAGCTAMAEATIDCVDPCYILLGLVSGCEGDEGWAEVGSVVGAAEPYTISWSNGGLDPRIDGLSNGTYICTVTDQNGCSASATVEVDCSSSCNLTVELESGCTANQGWVNIASVQGATEPYTVLWSNGGNGNGISGLANGTYTATVTDYAGCTATAEATIDCVDPCYILLGLVSGCEGGQGWAEVGSVVGAAEPYTISWSNGGLDPRIDGLSNGTYICTVTDQNGCSASATVEVDCSTSCNLTVELESGCTANQGWVNIASVQGATEPYTVLWSNGGNGNGISGLANGTYTATVTDYAGCTAMAEATIDCVDPCYILLGLVSGCEGDEGWAEVGSVVGAAEPYTISWSNGGLDPRIDGLSNGTYICTVTDQNGCSASATVEVDCSSSCNLTVELESGCTANQGWVNIASVQGATEPYTVLWSNGGNGNGISGLANGTYTATVTDYAGCTAMAEATIDCVDPCYILLGLVSGCEGDQGWAEVGSVVGAAEPYTISWSNGGLDPRIDGLSNGTYICTVTDQNGCSASATVEVDCSSSCNLTVELASGCTANQGWVNIASVQGATEPYTVLWSNGGNGNGISGLANGTYTATVTDYAGCTATAEATIDCVDPCYILLGLVSGCEGGRGWAEVGSVVGAAEPYTISWSNGGLDPRIDGLSNGTYICTVTDQNGCSASATVEVDCAECDLKIEADAGCYGGYCRRGWAKLTAVEGGTEPYTVLWSNGATDWSLNGLADGTYTVTVTDANGCTDVAEVEIDCVHGNGHHHHHHHGHGHKGHHDGHHRLKELVAYPTPVSEMLNVVIDAADQGRAHVYVLDLSGRVAADLGMMEFANAGQRQLTVDTKGLQEGVYILNVDMDGEKLTQRVVVVK